MKKIVGLILFILLFLLCLFIYKPFFNKHIERDLHKKVTSILKEQGHDPSGASFNGHELHLTPALAGQISEETHDELDSVIGLYFAKPAADSTSEPTPAAVVLADPSLNVIEDASGKIVVNGTVDTQETVDQIISSVNSKVAPNTQVINQLKIAEVAPIAALPALTKLIPTHLDNAEQARLNYSPQALKLHGIVDTNQQEQDISGLAKPVASNMDALENNLEVVPRQSLDLRVERQEGQVVVTGVLPSTAAQTALISKVKGSVGDTPVLDQTTVAERPDDSFWWQNHAASFIPTHFKGAAGPAFVDYEPANFAASGVYNNQGQHQASLAAAKQVPAKIKQDNNLTYVAPQVAEVVPAAVEKPVQSLDFRAERRDGQIVVTGLLPNKETQTQLLSQVKAGAGSAKVVDKTTLAENPTPEYWWKDHPAGFVSKHFQATDGPAYVSYKPDSFSASGVYRQQAEHKTSNDKLKPIPANVKQANNLVYNAPKEEPKPKGDDLAKNLKLLPVYFASDSDWLSPKETVKIKKAAAAILNSKSNKQGLTVGGFADQRGNPDYNKKLSLRRANAVRSKLISLGVPGDRLKLNHFGEDTSNMAKADHWKARRVEISLTPITE